jgi:hypothetical protein
MKTFFCKGTLAAAVACLTLVVATAHLHSSRSAILHRDNTSNTSTSRIHMTFIMPRCPPNSPLGAGVGITAFQVLN